MADFQGIWSSGSGGITSIVGGTNVTIDNTDPANPVINVGAVSAIVGWTPSANTASPNNTVNASRLLVNSVTANGDAVIQPKGAGALLAQLPDSTTTGGNKRGARAIDLQLYRTLSGMVAAADDSMIIGGINNAINPSATYTAIVGGVNNIHQSTSNNSIIVGGLSNDARGTYSHIIGSNLSYATATSVYSIVVGGQNGLVSGLCSSVIGGDRGRASGDYSMSTGYNSFARLRGMLAHGSAQAVGSAWGDLQREEVILQCRTINGSVTELTLDYLAPSTSPNNRYTIPTNGTIAFHGIIAARNENNTQSAGWEIKGVIHNNGGTVDFAGSPVVQTLGDNSAGVWQINVIADNTNKALVITVQGVEATNIRWACTLRAMQVGVYTNYP